MTVSALASRGIWPRAWPTSTAPLWEQDYRRRLAFPIVEYRRV